MYYQFVYDDGDGKLLSSFILVAVIIMRYMSDIMTGIIVLSIVIITMYHSHHPHCCHHYYYFGNNNSKIGEALP